MNLILLVFFGGLIGTVEVEIVSKVSMEIGRLSHLFQ